MLPTWSNSPPPFTALPYGSRLPGETSQPQVREGGRFANVGVVVALAVNGAGQREVLRIDVGPGEDGAFWLAFLTSHNAGGLSGVELIVTDTH